MEQRNLQEMKNDLSGDGFVKSPQRKALIERWAKHIPATVKNEYSKYCLATMFENQLGELKSFKEKHMIGEDTTSANTAPFIKYTFPLLRRVWPALIAPEIVSVQPMTAPVGAIFYFELKYGTAKGSVAQGSKLVKDFNRYYSSEFVDGESKLAVASATQNFTLAFLPVKVSTLSITVPSVSGVGVLTDNGLGVISGTGLTSGTVNYTTGAVNLVFAAPLSLNTPVVHTYQYNMESNSQVPEINVDIALVSVTAKSRKLKALWSSESADDLKALHGIDAEQELVSGVGSELALEIDREIIEDLRAGATGGQAAFDLTVPSGVKQRDHIVSMLTQMTLLSNQIGKNTLRGPANFTVMSYDLAAYIEQLSVDGLFAPVFTGGAGIDGNAETPQTWGVMKMGTLQSRWTCYKDPYLTANQMIMGFKGSSFVDAGYVWAPYVPLQVTASFLDPNDFKFRKGLRTRYAKLLARGEFFGKLTVANLGGVTPGNFGQVTLPF